MDKFIANHASTLPFRAGDRIQLEKAMLFRSKVYLVKSTLKGIHLN